MIDVSDRPGDVCIDRTQFACRGGENDGCRPGPKRGSAR